MADVSIIVIAFDVRDEVLRCLASIERHAPPITVETIVIDNGSDDGTAAAVNRAFPAARVLRLRRNIGEAARNHGLRRARGRHRMFLDSDAQLTPGALARLVALLDDDPATGVVGPKLVYPDGTLQLSTRRYPPFLLPLLRRPPLDRFFRDGQAVRRHLMADDAHEAIREVEYVLGACLLFSAAAQAAAGEFGWLMFYGPADADWCFRVRAAGRKVVYCPEATVIHDYRRTTAARRVSRAALSHLLTFYHFQWKWRRHRSRLMREGRRMDERAIGGEPAARLPQQLR